MTTKTDVYKSSCLLRHLARFQYFPITALSTYLQTRQFFPLRREKEEEALGCSWQRESSDQERDHHHVGEQGREVSHLAGATHALPEKENSLNDPAKLQ